MNNVPACRTQDINNAITSMKTLRLNGFTLTLSKPAVFEEGLPTALQSGGSRSRSGKGSRLLSARAIQAPRRRPNHAPDARSGDSREVCLQPEYVCLVRQRQYPSWSTAVPYWAEHKRNP